MTDSITTPEDHAAGAGAESDDRATPPDLDAERSTSSPPKARRKKITRPSTKPSASRKSRLPTRFPATMSLDQGTKTVYLRLIEPDGATLTQGGGTMTIEGQEQPYTASAGNPVHQYEYPLHVRVRQGRALQGRQARSGAVLRRLPDRHREFHAEVNRSCEGAFEAQALADCPDLSQKQPARSRSTARGGPFGVVTVLQRRQLPAVI